MGVGRRGRGRGKSVEGEGGTEGGKRVNGGGEEPRFATSKARITFFFYLYFSTAQCH